MDPGELDKRISIMVSTKIARDAAGAPVMGLTEIARPWAKVIQEGGREFLANDATRTEKRVVFRIWARSDFDASAVIRYKQVDHDIKDIRPFDDVTEIHTAVRGIAA